MSSASSGSMPASGASSPLTTFGFSSSAGTSISTSTDEQLTASGCVRRKRVRTVTGCLVCRRRRVKCDEARPRCKNCSKHPDRLCEYQYAAQPDPAVYPPLPTPMVSTPGRSTPAVIAPPLPDYKPAPIPPAPVAHPIPLEESQYFQLAQQVQQLQQEQQLDLQQHQAEQEARTRARAEARAQAQAQALAAPPPPAFAPPCDPSVYPPLSGSGGPAYADLFSRTQAAALAAESRGLDVLDPTGGTNSLANTLISNMPLVTTSQLRGLLQGHEDIVRQSFIDMASGDSESRLLCTATAYLSGGIAMPGTEARDPHAQDVMGQYLHLVRTKSRAFGTPLTKNQPVTGKLAAAGFTLFLSQILHPSPGKWKEQLAVGVEWAEARGGPGWVMGVSPPRPGFAGGEPVNVQPLAMTVYSDMTALLAMIASMSDGTIPTYITSDSAWLIASRALQLHLSPGLPDLFEAVISAPRIVIPVFARSVGLVSRRITAMSSTAPAPDMVLEMLEFDAAALRAELETAWPTRLAARPDPRRMQYGARIWIAAALVMTIHAAQRMEPEHPDVRRRVDVFFDLCSDTIADLGDLNGWIWPIVVVGCAATGEARDRYKDLVGLAKNMVVDRDNTSVAVHLLQKVYDAHDRGEKHYHVHQAVRDNPELDVLML